MLKRYGRFFGSLTVSWSVYSTDAVYAHTNQLYCFASTVWCRRNWPRKPFCCVMYKQAKQWVESTVLLPVCDIYNSISRGCYMYHQVENSDILIFVNKPNWCTFFSYMFISILHKFRAAMCPSSGELFVLMRHLVRSGEIIPTRCNNCVYSSQWLYSTCFGWQFHPSSGVQCCIWPFR